jgi:carbon-monoxide dehydrogenase iron sulfur subunit
MARQALVGYFDQCTGCEMCMLACSMEKYGVYSPKKAHIRISRDLRKVVFTPMACIQCDKPPNHDAPCMRSCPVGAITRDSRTNAVVIISEKCTGCRLCIEACPIDMVQFDEEAKKAFKCDLCFGEPKCVQYCQFNAIEYK